MCPLCHAAHAFREPHVLPKSERAADPVARVRAKVAEVIKPKDAIAKPSRAEYQREYSRAWMRNKRAKAINP